jgi:hypothetical protein
MVRYLHLVLPESVKSARYPGRQHSQPLPGKKQNRPVSL